MRIAAGATSSASTVQEATTRLAQWSLFISLTVGAVLTFLIVLTIVLGGSPALKSMFTGYDGLIQVIAAIGLLGFSFAMVKTAVGVWTIQQDHCRMLQDVRFVASNGRLVGDFVVEQASIWKVDAVKQAAGKLIEYGGKQLQQGIAHHAPGGAIGQQASSTAASYITNVAREQLNAAGESSGPSKTEAAAASVNTDEMSPGAKALCGAISELIQTLQVYDVAPAAFGLQMKLTLLQVLYGYVGTAVVAIVSRYVVSSFT